MKTLNVPHNFIFHGISHFFHILLHFGYTLTVGFFCRIDKTIVMFGFKFAQTYSVDFEQIEEN